MRGLALFGLVWSNYGGLSYWFMLSGTNRMLLPGASLEGVLEWFHGVFIEGKFYFIFSCAGHWRFIWRMAVLLGIGWLHLRYIRRATSTGRVPDRVLPWIAAVLILSPIALDGAKVLIQGAFEPSPPPLVRLLDAEEARLIPLVGHAPGAWARYVPEGGFGEWRNWLCAGWAWRFVHFITSNRIRNIFGLLLLGLWVAQGPVPRLEAWPPRKQERLALLVPMGRMALTYYPGQSFMECCSSPARGWAWVRSSLRWASRPSPSRSSSCNCCGATGGWRTSGTGRSSGFGAASRKAG